VTVASKEICKRCFEKCPNSNYSWSEEAWRIDMLNCCLWPQHVSKECKGKDTNKTIAGILDELREGSIQVTVGPSTEPTSFCPFALEHLMETRGKKKETDYKKEFTKRVVITGKQKYAE